MAEKRKPQKRADSLITEGKDPQQANADLKDEIERNKETLEKQKFLMREVDLLIRSGFDAIDINRIRVKLDEIAEKRGIEPETVRKVFIQNLESYDAMVGFRGKIDRAHVDEGTSAKKVAELEDKMKELEAEYGRKKTVLDAFSSLLEEGIGVGEILWLKEILESSGMNIEGLTQQIGELGDLTRKIESLRDEASKLDERAAQLRAELKELGSSHSQLQSSVELLNSQVLAKMEEIRGRADEFVGDAKDKIAALSEEMKKKIAAVDAEGAGQQLAAMMDELKNRVEQTSKEIVQIADTAAKEAAAKETQAAEMLSKHAILGLDSVHQQALRACKKYLGRAYETAATAKKIEYIMHYENLLALLRKQKSK